MHTLFNNGFGLVIVSQHCVHRSYISNDFDSGYLLHHIYCCYEGDPFMFIPNVLVET